MIRLKLALIYICGLVSKTIKNSLHFKIPSFLSCQIYFDLILFRGIKHNKFFQFGTCPLLPWSDHLFLNRAHPCILYIKLYCIIKIKIWGQSILGNLLQFSFIAINNKTYLFYCNKTIKMQQKLKLLMYKYK